MQLRCMHYIVCKLYLNDKPTAIQKLSIITATITYCLNYCSRSLWVDNIFFLHCFLPMNQNVTLYKTSKVM